MNILVLGGTGNIGRSIVERLLRLGHEVACFNRGRSGAPTKGARLILGDRSDLSTFETTMLRETFDAVIDMTCYTASQAQSNLRAFPVVGHLVHCSTVCVYGVQYDWMPVTEDHPLRPITDYGREKAAAEAIYLEAYAGRGYPVTILRPSTTYGPKMGMLRQVAWDYSWIDRIRKGKPILICGDGNALHQFLHVDDAAPGFTGVLGKSDCFGKVYNLTGREVSTWADYHRLAMNILGCEAEMVGVPMADLRRIDPNRFDLCDKIFSHSVYYSSERLFRDVPEFHPRISLKEGMRQVLASMEKDKRIPNSDAETWEDRIIEAQRGTHQPLQARKSERGGR